MKVTGVIERTSSRTLGNGSTSYGVLLNGTWYSTFDPVPSEGVNVEFEFTQKGAYKNINKGSIKEVCSPVPSSNQGQGGAMPPSSRDVSITYQSSRKDAIAIVTSMVGADIVALPSAKKDKYSAVLALVDELTNKFYNDIQVVIENGGVQALQEAPQPEDFA